ncbi:MAG: DUF255 domain-containing protein [Gemmatimonadetes bacterium]|nr:DUF255 domain-containing protein [Gemmatimonadota bacterium]MYI99651.1 DUF255 domain-containing protein [Gemmatimonadota bacterium]
MPCSARFFLAAFVLIAGTAVLGCDAGPGPPSNRLSGETSLYLRAHARNPVDWHPWDAEAIERARGEGKPIFLSVGYATCYWCHFMEREVFSDLDIAAVMNAHFVNIKVDREERPDIDEIYMTATQLITGGGGWPNSVFLTPDLEPFFAGTYFPPEDLPGRPGFPRVLNLLRDAWENRRDDLVEQAGRVAEAIRSFQRDQVASDGTAEPDDATLAVARSHLKTRYDAVNGGFGPAPKFPASLRIELALSAYERTGDRSLLAMATHTLDVMMRGGLYDHVGGGFHRYATDSAWRIPHFEKMLYNQADLARVYLLAFVMTGDTAYRAAAEDVLAFVQREMQSVDGAFHASVDSETDAVEGRYYLWSEAEITETLGADADVFLGRYGLTPMPGVEIDSDVPAGSGVLYVREEADSTGPFAGLEAMREVLRSARSKRKRPVVDPKVIAAWNGQMIDAFAYAGLVTGDGRYIETAARAADFMLDRLWDDELGLYRIYSDGAVRRRAFQEDYACLIGGLLSLYEASADSRWLVAAETLTNRMNERFWDPDTGGYYFGESEEYQLLRTRNAFDGARASGNGVAARVLLSLARHTGDTRYRTRASRLFSAYAASMKEVPGRFTSMILALQAYLHGEWDGVRTGDGAGGPNAAVGGAREVGGPNAVVDGAETGFGGNAKVEAYLNAVPGPRDGEFDATVSIRIEDGWHIIGDRTDVQGLVPTALTFNADLPIRTAAVSYPPADTLRFGFSDVPVEVYQGEIRLTARIEVDSRLLAEGGSLAEDGRLYATLYYQACNDAVCLAPEEKALSAPLDP